MAGDFEGSQERWRDRYPVLFVYVVVVGIPAALFFTAGLLYFFLFFDISMN